MSEKFLSHLQTIVSLSIAVLTLFSGLLGWQMGNISSLAAEEYDQAQRAELNRQQITSTNKLKAYEDYRAFLIYKNYFSQYKLVSLQLDQAQQAEAPDEKEIAKLSTQRNELEALYLSSLKLFPNQFINRDGTYNIQDEIGQLNAAAARKLDTDPDKFQRRGELYDGQVERMQITLIILAVALFFFAITSTVETLNRPTFFTFLILGYSMAIIGVALGLSYWQPILTDPNAPQQETVVSVTSIESFANVAFDASDDSLRH